MAQRISNPEFVRSRISEMGLTGAEVARRMGLTRNNFSRVLGGKRDLSFIEAKGLAEALSLPFLTVLAAFGIDIFEPGRYVIPVHGDVRDDDKVYFVEPAKRIMIPIPFTGYDGVVLRIDTDAYAPRFIRGEYIGAFGGLGLTSTEIFETDGAGRSYNSEGIENTIGKEVLVGFRGEEGKQHDSAFGWVFMLKRLQLGTEGGTYTLLSLDTKRPPLINVKPRLMGDLDWHIPRTKFAFSDEALAVESQRVHREAILRHVLED